MVAAVTRLVDAMQGLTSEVWTLRSQNDELQAELVRLRAVPRPRSSHPAGGRSSRLPDAARGAAQPRRSRRPGTPGRSTPPEVTDAVIRAALSKLGEATAAEIAAEITRAGTRVSGRAVRFLAEQTGAQVSVDTRGQRRYRLA